ncbi:MAG: hypothetical protein AAGD14_10070 [Planctomycetota bacterium]
MCPWKVGDEITVTPDALGKRGDSTATVDGWRLRIRGGVPGEAARVRIRHVSKGGPVAEADFVGTDAPSPLRREVVCPIHDRCGGCGLQHLDAFDRKVEQARQALSGEWGEPIRSPREYGYRTKTFLLSHGGRFGARPPRGSQLVDTAGCAVLRPEVEAACATVRERLDPRAVRTVMVRGNRAGQVQVTLVHRGPAPTFDLPFETIFTQRHDDDSNRICSTEREKLRRGSGAIEETWAGGLRTRIPPTAFVQGNPDVAEALYRAAADAVVGERVTEFYCGSGVAGLMTGLPLLGIDKSPGAVAIARENARRNGAFDRCRFEAMAAEDYDGPIGDTVLVNPPRAGCHESVLERIRGAARVVYLSCNPVTLARDIDRLGYRVESLRAADMLPQTPHLEVLAVLSP